MYNNSAISPLYQYKNGSQNGTITTQIHCLDVKGVTNGKHVSWNQTFGVPRDDRALIKIDRSDDFAR